jgi:hypothetical protein
MFPDNSNRSASSTPPRGSKTRAPLRKRACEPKMTFGSDYSGCQNKFPDAAKRSAPAIPSAQLWKAMPRRKRARGVGNYFRQMLYIRGVCLTRSVKKRRVSGPLNAAHLKLASGVVGRRNRRLRSARAGRGPSLLVENRFGLVRPDRSARGGIRMRPVRDIWRVGLSRGRQIERSTSFLQSRSLLSAMKF